MTKPLHETKQRLIETARSMIWQSSYGAVSVDDICVAADAKKGSFYHFFKSKADLAAAALEQDYAHWGPVYDHIFSDTHAPMHRFELLAEAMYQKQLYGYEKYGRVCGCPYATLGSELAGQEETVTQKASEILNQHLNYYEAAVRDLMAEGTLPKTTDPTAKAIEISAYLVGQMTMARIQNKIDSFKRDILAGLSHIINIDLTMTDALPDNENPIIQSHGAAVYGTH